MGGVHGKAGEVVVGVFGGGVSRSEGSCAAAAHSVVEFEYDVGVSRSDGSCAAAAHKVPDAEVIGVGVCVDWGVSKSEGEGGSAEAAHA